MIGLLVRDRVRIKIRIRVRVRVRVGVMFNVRVYRWSNCRRSKCRTFIEQPLVVVLICSRLQCYHAYFIVTSHASERAIIANE